MLAASFWATDDLRGREAGGIGWVDMVWSGGGYPRSHEQMPQATLRFYAELNDFLPQEDRHRSVPYAEPLIGRVAVFEHWPERFC